MNFDRAWIWGADNSKDTPDSDPVIEWALDHVPSSETGMDETFVAIKSASFVLIRSSRRAAVLSIANLGVDPVPDPVQQTVVHRAEGGRTKRPAGRWHELG